MIILDPSAWRVTQTPKKGRGVIATKTISPGVVIGDYLGRIISIDDDTDEDGLYGMCWSDAYCILPERKKEGIHLLNHSCMPNCGLYPYHGHMLFVTLRKIFVGEELTVSYMVEPGKDTGGWYTCYCHTSLCTGTMMTTKAHAKAFWDDFVRPKQGKYKDIPSVPMGDMLSPLQSYPKKVADNPVYDLFGNPNIPPYRYIEMTKLSVSLIRTLIRTTGLCIEDVERHTLIQGIQEGRIVSCTPWYNTYCDQKTNRIPHRAIYR
jgi:hypothetical protein